MKRDYIIAIDGPAGSGKSTVAREVARRLGMLYVDTGAMYRALTLKAIEECADMEDEGALAAIAEKADIELRTDADLKLTVLLDGRDVSEEIRKTHVTNNVQYIARVPAVRKQMVKLQRRAARSDRGAVLEGRDIGTVVFPDADKKIYLDAGIEERVKRRFRELKDKGHQVTLDEVRKDVAARDHSDMTRKVAPLKKAEDALTVDTTDMTIAEVAESIIKEVKAVQK